MSVLLIGVGIASDVIAGLAILEHQVLWGATLHVSATLIWMVGMAMGGVRHPTRTEAVEQMQSPADRFATLRLMARAITHNGQITAAFVLGLFLFPGLGPLGYTFAFGVAPFLGRLRRQETTGQDESAVPDLAPDIGRVPKAPTHPLVELEVQPLVEVVMKSDIHVKRAALELICREPGPRGMPLARSLLIDTDPDVRGLAAVAVSRLEAHFSELLRAAVIRRDHQPQVADYHAAVGHLYYQYARQASSNLVNRRFYLVQARNALDMAVSLGPARQDCLLSLAEVLVDLGEDKKAWHVLAKLLAACPGNSTGYLLGMEMALRERRLDKVVALAERACRFLADNDEALPMMKWWLEAKPVSEADMP